MKLLLDIGNTRIKWAVFGEQGLGAQQAIAHAGLDANQLRQQVLEPSGMVEHMFVANVGGEALAATVRQATQACWGLSPIFVATSAQYGAVRNAYVEHQKLGVDRWLALIGAYALAPTAVCVVDIGTATTIDTLDDTGLHLGGLIVPGPGLMMDSLLRHTSDIASFSQWRSMHAPHAGVFFADNTWDGVYLGALHATAALIDAAQTTLAEHSKLTVPRLLLTGGAADSVAPLLHAPLQLLPDLVLRGLAVVAQQ